MTTGFKCPRMGYGIPPFMTIKQWNSGLPHFRILLICLPIMMGISCYFMKQTWGRVTIIGVCHGLWRLWTLKPAFRTWNLGSLHRSFLKWFIPSLPEPSYVAQVWVAALFLMVGGETNLAGCRISCSGDSFCVCHPQKKQTQFHGKFSSRISPIH